MFVGTRTRNSQLGYVADIDDSQILEFAEEALKRPSDSYWRDGDLWETHTLMFHSAPDSDDTVAQSNFRSILQDLGDAYKRSDGAVESASVGHWTYSSFDCIKVRVTYANGEIHPAFADAVQIAIALRDNYPLYSEDDHSELESEVWDRAISEAVTYALESEDDGEEIKSDVTEYLYSEEAQVYGYQECGYVPDEAVENAISHARNIRDRAIAVGLTRPNNSGDPIF